MNPEEAEEILRDGRDYINDLRAVYFFSRKIPPKNGIPVEKLPKGYGIGINPNGFPYIKRI